MESTSGRAVTVPLFICDTFANDYFKGNQTAVCMIPSSVYCMEWSGVKNLEASFGRGEPEDVGQTEEERGAEIQAYADERDAKMGRAFQNISREMNIGECAFVYRIPAAREKDILDKIRVKENEFEKEFEERVKVEQERQLNSVFGGEEGAAEAKAGGGAAGVGGYDLPPGLLQGVSFSMTSFGASFLQTQQMSMIGGGVGSNARRPRRMYTQWFGLRWFTPTGEPAFCGQAAIAAAHTIFESTRFFHVKTSRHLVSNVPVEFFIPTQTDVLCFVTRAGIISVRYKEGNGGSTGAMGREGGGSVETYEVHLSSNEAFSIVEQLPATMRANLAGALGLPDGAEAIVDVALNAASGLYVVVLKQADAVQRVRPTEASLRGAFTDSDFVELRRKHPELVMPHGLIVTAENDKDQAASHPSADGDAQILLRVFTPWVGPLEDAVSSFALTAILPYWLRRLNGSYKVGDKLMFYQGSRRGGTVQAIIIGKKADRVALIGPVITFLRGNANFTLKD